MVLDSLEAAYGSAELDTFLHVLGGHFQHAIGADQHLGPLAYCGQGHDAEAGGPPLLNPPDNRA